MQATLTPRHYQVTGIEYLTTPNVFQSKEQHYNHSLAMLQPTCARHILSDAPGAGKTPQSIWAALDLTSSIDPTKSGDSILILAPAHLCKQWYEYLCEHWPEYRTIWLEGTKATRIKDASKKAKFYICSVQSLRQEHYYELLVTLVKNMSVTCTIIDESHYVKNSDATTSVRVRALTRPAACPHVILLTATPVVREADDLYMQLQIVDPWTFHRKDIFLNTYCWFTMGSWGYSNVVLRKGATEKLQPWLWGRTYADIGLELPPIISNVHASDMPAPRRKLYDDLKYYWYAQFSAEHQAMTAGSAMEVMHMLRRITASDDQKIANLTSYLADDPGPYLIACDYKISARSVAVACTKAGYPAVVIDGDIGADDRKQVAMKATTGANASKGVVVATIKSLSEGVDLSNCSSVYFFEEDWTPGKMYQFLSRVRRHRNSPEGSLGVTITEDAAGTSHLHVDEDPNDKPIIVRYFHAYNTIDERIHAVQGNRSLDIKSLVKVELGL